MNRRWVIVMILLALLAPRARGEAVADLDVGIVKTDKAHETAIGLLRAIHFLQAESPARAETALTVGCQRPEPGSWYMTLRCGDTLRFELVKQGAYRLLVPERGFPVDCRCSTRKHRGSLLQAAFVTPAGLRRQLRLGGWFRPKKPKLVRLRVGWDDDLTWDGPATSANARAEARPCRAR